MTKRKSKPGCPAAPRKFKVGDRVWVRHGVMDEDHPDMPLGGWAGTIFAIGKRGRCGIRWSEETLAAMHPIWKKRCAIDGADLKEYWLKEAALEPDPGEPLSIEQPTCIEPRPLSTKDSGDRVRMVFGLTSDDFLPATDRASLRRYRGYLAEHLALPAEAHYSSMELLLDRLAKGKLPLSGSPINRLKVEVLAVDRKLDPEDGVYCRVRSDEGEETVRLADLAFRRADANHRLAEDFSAWFFGGLSEDLEDEAPDDGGNLPDNKQQEDEPPLLMQGSSYEFLMLPLGFGTFAFSLAAAVGAAAAVMPWARWAACFGGVAWGAWMVWSMAAASQEELFVLAPRAKKPVGALLGLIKGTATGAFVGVVVTAFVGAALGAIVGFLLKRAVRKRRRPILSLFPSSVLLATAGGVLAQSFLLDPIVAWAGLQIGAVVGLAAALAAALVVIVAGKAFHVKDFDHCSPGVRLG